MTIELQRVVCIVIAALGGAAVGLEREWLGHASGPEAHFAGIRTLHLIRWFGRRSRLVLDSTPATRGQ